MPKSIFEGLKAYSKVMKNILFINDLLISGGVEVMMHNLIQNMDAGEYRITVMTAEYDKRFYKIYRKGVRYVPLEPNVKNGGIVCKIHNKILYSINNPRIKRVIKYSDIIVLMAIKTGRVAKFVADLPCKRKIAWIHGDLSIQKIVFTKEESDSLKNFEKIVCVAETVMESAKKVIGEDLNYIVRYNPIDVQKILEKSNEPIKEIKRNGRKLFVTVGRLTYAKGYNRLIQICKELGSKYDFDLWIIGEGEERITLEEIIKTQNITNVFLLGEKKNPYPYIKMADWFISSSIHEGFSIALQEAAILEKSIIATECSGVRELLGSSEYGIVVKNTYQDLYSGMSRVLQDEGLKEKYYKKVKQVRDFMNLEYRIKKIEELF